MKYTAEELQQFFIQGFLFLEGSDIEELPEGLVVERDADLRECENLAELPKGLKVGKWLNIRDTGLSRARVPEDAQIGKKIYCD